MSIEYAVFALYCPLLHKGVGAISRSFLVWLWEEKTLAEDCSFHFGKNERLFLHRAEWKDGVGVPVDCLNLLLTQPSHTCEQSALHAVYMHPAHLF